MLGLGLGFQLRLGLGFRLGLGLGLRLRLGLGLDLRILGECSDLGFRVWGLGFRV